MRERPGGAQLLITFGFALACGLLGAVLGPALVPRPGMGGLFAGVGFAAAFLAMWRGFGGTLADIRAVFR